MKKRIYDNKNKKRTKYKIPKKRQYKEHNHQVAVFQFAKMYESQHPELKLMTGSLAGVNLDIRAAKRAKEAGHKAGFPDIHLPVARGQWFGLYVEMKTDEGKASPEQLVIARMLRDEGHLVLFIRGSELAWNNILKYLTFKKLLLKKGKSPDETTKAQLPNPGPEVPLSIPGGPRKDSPGPGV